MATLKNKSLLFLFTVCACLFFFSCQKDIDYINIDGQGPDLITKVSSSVSGFVTDENNAAVAGASVSAGGSNTTTNKFGFFEIKNIQVIKNAATVKVTRPGYFNAVKTYIAADNKAASFRIKLVPKTIIGNINASSGGSISLPDGFGISLPANAVVNASSNVAYTGTINVTAQRVDPTATDFISSLPGDMRGIGTDGVLKLLKGYGLAAVELTGASGELLQIASGKKATLTLPIPNSLSSTAPASIPLWYFDEATGLWKEQGSATRTGNSYVGDVSHFSWWYMGFPGPYIQFNCTVKDQAGNPLECFMTVTMQGNPGGIYGFGTADAGGYLSGPIPANSALTLSFYMNYYTCPILMQNITTTNTDLSLGDIAIDLGPSAVHVSGTVTNCSNAPVTNGYIFLQYGVQYNRYPVSNTGAFNFTTTFCSNPSIVNIIAEDQDNLQYSTPSTYTLSGGNNSIGNIVACGNQVQEYMNYTINGNANHLINPPDYVSQNYSFPGSLFLSGYQNNTASYLYIGMSHPNFAPNVVANLTNVICSQVSDSMYISTPIPVNITEYGNIGEHISGNFAGTMTSFTNPSITYNMTCNFRIRRDQ